jgi:predicted ester cyclase
VVTTALEDYRSDVRSLFAEPGLAAARVVSSGTHRGPLPGVAPTPTGRRLTWAGTAWFPRAEDGRADDVWVLGDAEASYRQVNG